MNKQELIQQVGIHCCHCPDQGWYENPNRYTGHLEQVQCEFCSTRVNSVFNLTRLLKGYEIIPEKNEDQDNA